MKENELFEIQNGQLNVEIAKIQWIANNPDKLIRALRAKIAEENLAYLNDVTSAFRRRKFKIPVSHIFRGQDISTWLTNHVQHELVKEFEA